MKKGCLAGIVCLALVLLSGCGASDARQESTLEPGSTADDGGINSSAGETLSGTEQGSCRDYPLRDGTMVRQYDYGGTSSYTLFRYRADGGTEKLTDLFIRDELIYPDSADPCPYYEIGGMEVDKDTFEEQLKKMVADQRLESSDWTALVP